MGIGLGGRGSGGGVGCGRRGRADSVWVREGWRRGAEGAGMDVVGRAMARRDGRWGRSGMDGEGWRMEGCMSVHILCTYINVFVCVADCFAQ